MDNLEKAEIFADNLEKKFSSDESGFYEKEHKENVEAFLNSELFENSYSGPKIYSNF